MVYAFNNIVVDTQTYRLLVDGEEASVEPQVFSLLVYLIQNKGKVVTRNELLTHVWKGRIVSDISINNNIKSARKVLGDDGSKQQVIKTIYSRGYQFVAKTNSDTSSESAIAVDSILKDSDSSQAETVAEVNSKVLFKQVIAVLPFTNTKPDVETDYLSFALASQIIGDLSYLEKFNISPAGSISKYANQVVDPIAVGRELAVNYVLSGNYLAENKTIRLNVELIEIEENRLVWRESIQVDYDNTFALQDMVTQRVAKGLDAGFKRNFIKQQHRDIPSSSLAFEYYLRAISYPQSNDGHKMAVEMLEKSIKLDPEYAPSYARLGFQARLLEQHGRIAPDNAKDTEWYYLKALELNPMLLEAMSYLIVLYTETNRIEEALRINRRMLDINPDDSDSHFSLGYIYRYAGMLQESIQAMETALTISPDDPRYRSIVATYISAGEYQNALNRVYLDKGDYGIGYSGVIAFKQAKFDQAKEYFKQVIEIDPSGVWGLIAKFHLAFMNGKTGLALKVLSQMVDTDIFDAENMYHFAEFYGLLNEKEAALGLLEQAVDAGYFSYPSISRSSAFIFVQDDADYIKIINKAKQRHCEFRTNFL